MPKTTYICPNCGKTHELKYKDSLLCSECLMPEFRKIGNKIGSRIIFK